MRIRLPFESSFWISGSGWKLTILPDIQPANRIVIISAVFTRFQSESTDCLLWLSISSRGHIQCCHSCAFRL